MSQISKLNKKLQDQDFDKNDIIDSSNGFRANKIPRINIKNIDSDQLKIPNYREYKTFKNKIYKTYELKEICKHYILHVSGTKPILTFRIYNYLLKTNFAIIIQSRTRGKLRRTYNKLFGDALFKRSLCKNSSDFFTMDEVSQIPYNQFISVRCNNNIWGFDLLSLFNLFIKTENTVIFNPYSREELDYKILLNIKKIIHMAPILNNPVNIVLNAHNDKFCKRKNLEFKCLDLFHEIDELGNYTKAEWFLSLNKYEIIRFIRELIDIWEYRAQLSSATKAKICYPYGQPFLYYLNIRSPISTSLLQIQDVALNIIGKFIQTALNKENRILGANFVLCALTLVNSEAAESLPWLYQSVINY